MSAQILVCLRRSDRIEQILPYIERIAQPGIKVVFLIHCGLNGFQELLDQMLAISARISSTHPAAKTRNIWEDQRHLLNKEALTACAGIIDRGIEIGVNVYAGRLGRVVREYMAHEEVHLVLIRPRCRTRLTNLLFKMVPLGSPFNPPLLSPVLLLHPNHTAER